MFLKNKNIIFKIRRSKVTDYAALNKYFVQVINEFQLILLCLIVPKMKKVVTKYVVCYSNYKCFKD